MSTPLEQQRDVSQAEIDGRPVEYRAAEPEMRQRRAFFGVGRKGAETCVCFTLTQEDAEDYLASMAYPDRYEIFHLVEELRIDHALSQSDREASADPACETQWLPSDATIAEMVDALKVLYGRRDRERFRTANILRAVIEIETRLEREVAATLDRGVPASDEDPLQLLLCPDVVITLLPADERPSVRIDRLPTVAVERKERD